MKSIHLCLSAILLSLTHTAELHGQTRSSQILTRGQVAAVPVEHAAIHAATANPRPAPTANAATRPSFPSLSPSSDQAATSDASDRESAQGALASPAITVTFSLALVLGLFAGLVWVTRKFGTRSISQGSIPKDVLQGLGSTPIDARTRITLVRCGNRILVMAQTATGVQPLTEISDPDEVQELTAACLGNSKQAFASALQSIEKEKANAGYVGAQADSTAQRDRGRLFANA